MNEAAGRVVPLTLLSVCVSVILGCSAPAAASEARDGPIPTEGDVLSKMREFRRLSYDGSLAQRAGDPNRACSDVKAAHNALGRALAMLHQAASASSGAYRPSPGILAATENSHKQYQRDVVSKVCGSSR